MDRKNAFDYVFLGIFIMCIAFAMGAALEYDTVATERPYLLQGAFLLIAITAAFGALAVARAARGMKLSRGAARWIERDALVVIVTLGACLRVMVIEHLPVQPESDFETYYQFGSLLARGELLSKQGALYRAYAAQFPHTIGYPMLILQHVFRWFGEGVKAALYANLALSMGSVLLAYRIVRAGGRRGRALLAAALMSLWPSHILYANMVASEPAFTFFILLALWMGAELLRPGALRDKRPAAAAALTVPLGVCLGVANAIRPMALILTVAICVALARAARSIPADAPAGEQFLARGKLCAVVVLAAYLLTGAIVTQRVSTLIQMEPAGGLSAAGYNLMVGANAKHKGVWNQEDADFFRAAFEETGSAAAAHGASMRAALERIARNPEDTLNLYVYKFRDLWQSDDFGIDWNLLWLGQQDMLTEEIKAGLEAVRPAGRAMYFCLLVFVLAAAARQWGSGRKVEPIFLVCVLFFLGTALLHMLLETQVRYHYNMVPFFIVGMADDL